MSYIVYSENAIQNVHTTVDDIKTIVSQLNNSAAGHDELPPSIMKQLCNEYCIPLSYITNSSIIQGDFPEELKLAKVIPIYKADNEQHIQNYRPISVNANSILYEKQFGFRQRHATSHAIMTLVEKVTKALDTGKIVVGVYLDIRKAFDSISTSILLDKFIKLEYVVIYIVYYKAIYHPEHSMLYITNVIQVHNP